MAEKLVDRLVPTFWLEHLGASKENTEHLEELLACLLKEAEKLGGRIHSCCAADGKMIVFYIFLGYNMPMEEACTFYRIEGQDPRWANPAGLEDKQQLAFDRIDRALRAYTQAHIPPVPKRAPQRIKVARTKTARPRK